jgi:hypothetical protein
LTQLRETSVWLAASEALVAAARAMAGTTSLFLLFKLYTAEPARASKRGGT